MESFEPRLGRLALNYASRALDPEILGLGFHILQWSDERMGLRIFARSRSAGTLVTLSEFMVRALLGRHLPLMENQLRIRQIALDLNGPIEAVENLKFELVGAEREAWFAEAQAQGQSQREFNFRLWNASDQSVGEIRLTGQLELRMALPS